METTAFTNRVVVSFDGCVVVCFRISLWFIPPFTIQCDLPRDSLIAVARVRGILTQAPPLT